MDKERLRRGWRAFLRTAEDWLDPVALLMVTMGLAMGACALVVAVGYLFGIGLRMAGLGS